MFLVKRPQPRGVIKAIKKADMTGELAVALAWHPAAPVVDELEVQAEVFV